MTLLRGQISTPSAAHLPGGRTCLTAIPLIVTRISGSACLALCGELDIATGPVLDDALRALIARKPAGIRVDLAGLTFIDAAGLGRLVGCHNAVTAYGATFRVTNPSPFVHRVITICGLDALLDHDAPADTPPPGGEWMCAPVHPSGPAQAPRRRSPFLPAQP